MPDRLQQRLVEIGAPADVRALAADLTAQAVRDPLTGLYNRRFFDETLAQTVETARRYGRDLSLVLFDLDHLKELNDTCGHPAGDRALKTVTHLLMQTARKADMVCRIGGDEFAILLSETALPAARLFLERFFNILRGFNTHSHRAEGILSVTAGAASLPAEDLYAAADAALLQNKAGRSPTPTQ